MKRPHPVSAHWAGSVAEVRRIYGVQTVHCWAAGRWFTPLSRLYAEVTGVARGGGHAGKCGAGAGHLGASINGIGELGVHAIQHLANGISSGNPICCSAFQRGRVISARLLRSPVSSDCAFILEGCSVSSRYTFLICGLARRFLLLSSL